MLRAKAANDVASGSGKIEYRLLKLPNEVYKHFLVEFKNDRKTKIFGLIPSDIRPIPP